MNREREQFIAKMSRSTAALLTAGLALAASGCTAKSSAFEGGCAPFGVYAQDRWAPVGTAVRAALDVLSKKIGAFAPNEVIATNGWIDTKKPVYPTNTPPWNSGKWFHLANEEGWVSFAGVRGEPTALDPTGLSKDGGQPAPTKSDCEGTYNP